MAQARRKTPAKTSNKSIAGYVTVVGLLLAGAVIGALATVLWHGARDGGSVGAGIGAAWQGITQSEPSPTEPEPAADGVRVIGKSTSYDFYAVLKNEVIIPPESKPEVIVETAIPADAADTPTPNAKSVKTKPADSAYMLQVGSYRDAAAAEAQKATLAFKGLSSTIQKIKLQDGDVYRVQLGPFKSVAEIKPTEQKLQAAGLTALLIKVSGAPKSQ